MNFEELRRLIANCFGDVDQKFAVHAMDEARSKEVKKLIKSGQISGDEALTLVAGHLYLKGCSGEHIKMETDKARKKWGL